MKNDIVEKVHLLGGLMYATKPSVENGSIEKVERGEKVLSKVAVSLIVSHPNPDERGARTSKRMLEEIVDAEEWFMVPAWKEQLKAEFLKESIDWGMVHALSTMIRILETAREIVGLDCNTH